MKLLDFIIYRARWAAVIAALGSAGLFSFLFWLSDAYRIEPLPAYIDSRDQLLGLMILMVLVPAFLLAFVITTQRRSMLFAQELVTKGILSEGPENWLRPMRWRTPLVGVALGMTYGLAANTPTEWLTDFGQLGAGIQSLVVGQTLMWMIVGFALSYRLSTAVAFNRIGKTVKANILDTTAYGPFARNGVDDVLSVAILLVLSTVQALDAQFRVGNYIGAMIVAVPAAAFLFLLPMLSIHRRLADSRDEHLGRVDREIASLKPPSSAGELQVLETLLQHRDRIRDTLLWPINRSVSSRLAVYVFIPPIAWLGAAFVEFGLGRILGDT